MYGNLSENFLVKQVVAPQAIASGSVNGSSVDCSGYETLLVDIEIGAIVDAANKSLTVKLQDSANNSDWADITGATTGAILAAGDGEPYLMDVNLSEVERYVRAVATAGSADGGLVAVAFILGKGRHLPPTQVNTVIQVGY